MSAAQTLLTNIEDGVAGILVEACKHPKYIMGDTFSVSFYFYNDKMRPGVELRGTPIVQTGRSKNSVCAGFLQHIDALIENGLHDPAKHALVLHLTVRKGGVSDTLAYDRFTVQTNEYGESRTT